MPRKKKSMNAIAEGALEKLKEKGLVGIEMVTVNHHLCNDDLIVVGRELRCGDLVIIEVFKKKDRVFYRRPPGARPFPPRDECWPVLDAYFEEVGIPHEESLR